MRYSGFVSLVLHITLLFNLSKTNVSGKNRAYVAGSIFPSMLLE
jgi:hypothetical protein